MASRPVRVDGVLVTWNDGRGFGFARPSNGSADAFVHIRDFGVIDGRPRVGDRVSYVVGVGRDGRPLAVDVRGPARLNASMARPLVDGIFALVVVGAFVTIYSVLNWLKPIPLSVLAVYLGASLVTFGAYGLDKARALASGWRVSESTLLALGLLGGWPGAILAQQVFRHKTKKPRFRRAFWGTVALNLLAFTVIATPLVRQFIGRSFGG